MIIINNVNLPLNTDFSSLEAAAAKAVKTDINNIVSASLYRKSVDARHKNDVHFCCSILLTVKKDEEKILGRNKNASRFTEKKYEWKKAVCSPTKRPVVVGFGPAGMFAALTLARAGLKPLVVERGSSVEIREQKIKSFFDGNALDTECNIQFGEGGAGTFSDGKLTTGIKDERCRAVLELFVEKGANECILTDAKPHIGTDVLKIIVKNIRNEIIRLGGEVRFDTKLEDIIITNGKVSAVKVGESTVECDIVLLACGHSARDIFELLNRKDIKMEKKPFSVGVRIEHLRKDIDKALYGDFADDPNLSAADYKLSCHTESGRGVYTFCMCPGGYVINASSEKGMTAVNGMSFSRRDGENSNSAVLVNVLPEDFPENDVLAGCRFQGKIERTAYDISDGKVPVTTVGHFLNNKPFKIGRITPTVKPGFKEAEFSDIFPDFITENLKKGISRFGKIIPGFDCDDAVLTAPETRSSSPVRVLRNDDFESVSLNGLYPCGEGAGYAGGIMSAAVDGIKIAERIIDRLNTD